MKFFKIIAPTLLSSVGVLMVIGGEIDDSPGLGGIGLILIGLSLYINYKIIKK